MTEDALVETVAEALWLAQPEYFVSPWLEISETTRERYRAKAVAAIAAYRAAQDGGAEEACKWHARRCSVPNALCFVDCAALAPQAAGEHVCDGGCRR